MKNIGIICGGFSSEFEISMLSANTIKNNFPENYTPWMVVLNRKGWWVQTESGELELDAKNFCFQKNGNQIQLDAAIIYIHGDPGENGKVQAYLEMIDVPYANSGPLASELSFDKWYCNQFLRGFGVNVAKSIHLTSNKNLDYDHILKELGLPIFVKPCDSGSSYGIAKITEANQLPEGIEKAFAEGRTVVMESFLKGTEVTCGVYRNASGVQALPITEIVSENDFFDYEAKYQGKSQEITPARVPDEVRDKVQAIARKIYDLLQLRSIARIDFMVVDGEPFLIEVNTTPGFSPESIVPKMLKEAGISIKQFWEEILETELSH